MEDRRCKCKKSKCLKLYCECFAAHVYCTPGECGCFECNNLTMYETSRVTAIESALIRNPDAFTNKVTKAEKRAQMTSSSGCNCKKSLCLKKYCECFFTGMLCLQECKCMNCSNYVGSNALREKREQMRVDAEQADLVSKVGVVAAAAIKTNNVNVEQAKRQAMEIQERGGATPPGSSGNNFSGKRGSNRGGTRGASQASKMAENAQASGMNMNMASAMDVGDINQYDFALQMNSLDVSKATPGLEKQGSGTFRNNAPPKMNLVNLSEEDWAFAAGMAAEEVATEGDDGDELGMDPAELYQLMGGPDSTKSQGGARKKKGRLFSPKTMDINVAQGGKGGGGGSSKALPAGLDAFNFNSVGL